MSKWEKRQTPEPPSGKRRKEELTPVYDKTKREGLHEVEVKGTDTSRYRSPDWRY